MTYYDDSLISDGVSCILYQKKQAINGKKQKNLKKIVDENNEFFMGGTKYRISSV